MTNYRGSRTFLQHSEILVNLYFWKRPFVFLGLFFLLSTKVIASQGDVCESKLTEAKASGKLLKDSMEFGSLIQLWEEEAVKAGQDGRLCDEIECFQQIGLVYAKYMGESFKAVAYLDSVWNAHSFDPQDSVSVQRALDFFIIKGFILQREGLYHLAVEEYEVANSFFQRYLPRSPKVAKNLFEQSGNIYTRIGEYERARLRLEYGLEMCLQAGDEQLAAGIYSDLGVMFHDMNMLLKAEEQYKEGLALTGADEFMRGILYLNYGVLKLDPESYLHNEYQGENYLDTARVLLEKARFSYPDRIVLPHLGFLERALGDMAVDKGYYGIIREQYQKSLDILKEAYGSTNRREFAKSYIGLGHGQLTSLKIEEGLTAFQFALQSVLSDFSWDELHDLPPLSQVYPENSIIEAVLGKAKAFERRYLDLGDTLALSRAISCHRYIAAVEDTMQRTYLYQAPKLELAKERHWRTEKAIGFCLKMYQESGDQKDLWEAFWFCEKGKGAVFRETVQENEAYGRITEADSLLKQVVAEKKRLVRAQYVLTKDSSDILGYSEVKLKAEKNLQGLKTRLRNEHPSYFNAKYLGEPVGKEALQPLLARNEQTLVEYFCGRRFAYIFVIDSVDIDVLEVRLSGGFRSMVADLREAIEAYNVSNLNSSELARTNIRFSETSHKVYQQLVKPVEDAKPKLNERWVIVPDGPVFPVPFSALIREKPANSQEPGNFKWFPYAVTTAYSASLYNWQCQDRKNTSESNFLGIAPVEFAGGTVRNLEGSDDFVKDIERLFGGSSLIHNKASKRNFLEEAPEANVVLLFSHGKAYTTPDSSRYSHVYFAGQEGDGDTLTKLTLEDLYTLRLDLTAEMVVLLACESAYGPAVPGEGMPGITEGIFLAGSPGVAATLWEVNDLESRRVSKMFFENLAKGEPKDLALLHAQETYRGSLDPVSTFNNPFFWGALNIYGSPAELTEIPGGGCDWIWVVIMVGILLIGILVRRILKRRRTIT